MIADSVWTLLGQHALSFLGGVLVGLAGCSRWRIVRRKEDE